MVRLHLWLAILWALLLIPTILWWHSSLLWILIVSLYANAVGHLSAFQAARAESKVICTEETILDKLKETDKSEPHAGGEA